MGLIVKSFKYILYTFNREKYKKLKNHMPLGGISFVYKNFQEEFRVTYIQGI